MNFIDQDYSCNIFPEEDYLPFYVEESYKIQKNDINSGQIQRKERILKNRQETKLKQQLKNPEHSSTSQVIQSKEETRKQRNRNAAQQSRDRKKVLFDQLVHDNEELKLTVEAKDNYLQTIIDENHRLSERIHLLEEINQSHRCISCMNQLEQPELIRTNVYTNKQILNYGLLSLLAVVSVLSIVSTGDGSFGKPSAIYFNQIQTPPDFLHQDKAENMLMPTLHNHLAIPEHSSFNQTLLYNCTAQEAECNFFLGLVKAQNADNIYYINDPNDDFIQRNQSHYPVEGDQVFMVKVKQDEDDNFHVFKAICTVTESTNLLLQQESYLRLQ